MDFDLMVRKQSFDQFIREVACRLGDLSIIVTDKPTKDLMQQISEVVGILKSSKKMKIITIAYNGKSIESKADLDEFFQVCCAVYSHVIYDLQKEVVDKFKCTKMVVSKPDIFYYYSTSMIKGDLFKVGLMALLSLIYHRLSTCHLVRLEVRPEKHSTKTLLSV